MMCEDIQLECHGPPYQKQQTDLASQFLEGNFPAQGMPLVVNRSVSQLIWMQM